VSHNTTLLDILTEVFFGDSVQDYEQLLDSIISCKKLEEFVALELSFDAPKLDEIFERAAKEVDPSLDVRPARYDAIYKQVKPVCTHTDFI